MANESRFEVFPEVYETRSPAAVPAPTGQFVWHFKDANGRITFTGGESFARREDAHRAIIGACADVACALEPSFHREHVIGNVERQIEYAREDGTPPLIVDLDENGEPISR